MVARPTSNARPTSSSAKDTSIAGVENASVAAMKLAKARMLEARLENGDTEVYITVTFKCRADLEAFLTKKSLPVDTKHFSSFEVLDGEQRFEKRRRHKPGRFARFAVSGT